MEDLKDKRYLADGLYAGHDGYQFILYCERDNGTNWVGLDPLVINLFDKYVKDITKKYDNNESNDSVD